MSIEVASPVGVEGKPCIICETPLCACRGANEPHVGRPLDLAAMIERPDGTYTTLKATERILIAKMDQPGAYEVLYNVGDPIRLEDAIALGLYSPSGQPTAQQMVAAVKTGPEPRENEKTEGKASEADRKVPRDKAMRGPREKKEKPDG